MKPLDAYIYLKALAKMNGLSVATVVNNLGNSGSVLAIKSVAALTGVTVPTALKHCEDAFQVYLNATGLTEEQVLDPVIEEISKRQDDFMSEARNYKGNPVDFVEYMKSKMTE